MTANGTIKTNTVPVMATTDLLFALCFSIHSTCLCRRSISVCASSSAEGCASLAASVSVGRATVVESCAMTEETGALTASVKQVASRRIIFFMMYKRCLNGFSMC